MTKNFKIAVIGATSLGCGIAFEGRENVVLIDEGVDLASDYTRTLRPMEAVKSGGIVANELIRRGLVGRGVSTPSLDAIMCGLLKNTGAKLLLCCRLTSTKRVGDKIEVEYFGTNGFGSVICDKVVDTRTFSGERIFNLICARIGDGELFCNGFESFPGGFDSEGFLSLAISPDVKSPRIEALARFENGSAQLSDGWKIAAAANEIDIRGEMGITETDGIVHIQSSAYQNADVAFEEGRKCYTAVL